MEGTALAEGFEKILQQERADSQQALIDYFHTYYQRVYNYIYYRVQGKYTAEDLTSQVFEKLMESLGKYDQSRSPFEVWLFAVARNVVNDHYRKLKRQQFFSLEVVKGLTAKEGSAEDVVVQGDTHRELMDALNTLSPREQHLIALKYGADLGNNEIAPLMNLTESHVGVILHRAMGKLKKAMERMG